MLMAKYSSKTRAVLYVFAPIQLGFNPQNLFSSPFKTRRVDIGKQMYNLRTNPVRTEISTRLCCQTKQNVVSPTT